MNEGLRVERERPRGEAAFRRDAAAILAVWSGFLLVSFFVDPNYEGASIGQLIYYSFYNVTVGAFVGLFLLDRLPSLGAVNFSLQAGVLVLIGTLLNEAWVEPVLFGSAALNGEGVYHGLVDVLAACALFTMLRLIQRLRGVSVERVAPRWPQATPGELSTHLFIRVAGETRRIKAREVLYMAADRDFTRVVCASGEHFVSEGLKSLVARSARFGIVRVHKSFAVNLERVVRATRTEVHLDGYTLPVGRRHSKAFLLRWTSR